MSGVTDDMVTSGLDAADPQTRIASLKRRRQANPDNIGLHLRLAYVLEEAGQIDEARQVIGETVARFPNNRVAKLRLEALQERAAPADIPTEPAPAHISPQARVEPAAPAAAPPPAFVPETMPAPAAAPAVARETAWSAPVECHVVPERRFAAQDELLHLARVAGGVPAYPAHPAELQPEPSVRLRLNPLSTRYRAEVYFAAGVIGLIAVSGAIAWYSRGSGLLIDRMAPTPIVLAPRPADQATPPAPTTTALPAVAVPHTLSRTETEALATPASALVVATLPPVSQPPIAAQSRLPALPIAALPEVVLAYPAGDAGAAQLASDLSTTLQREGVVVRPAAHPASRQAPGVAFFFAEDAPLARTVAAMLGTAAGQVRQAAPQSGGAMLPGTIRITLPATTRPSRPG